MSKPAKTPKVRPVLSPLTRPGKLAVRSWKDAWRHKQLLLLIVAIVQLPVTILALFTGGNTQSTAGTNNSLDPYANFAYLFMNVALLFVVFAWHKGDNQLSLKRAYYDSSKFVLRFLLAVAVVIVGLLPAMFGLLLYLVAKASTVGVPSTLGEQAIIIGFCLLVSLPSYWFLNRYLLGPVVVVAEDLGPLAALARSRRLSLGRFWSVIARLLMLLLVIIAAALAVLAPGFILTLLVPGSDGWATVYFEVAAALIILPYSSVYLVNLYHDLAKTTDQ